MTRLLTPRELAALDRALAKHTRRRVRVGRSPITVEQGIALWHATAPLRGEVRDAGQRQIVLGTGALLAATASLTACATLGGNIKGDFSCRAPDGICAPTSTIDDAALALIGGKVSATPAGPYTPSTDTSARSTLASAKPVRSGEKVLRIVFPAHIDGAGRFRETTAVHAVVERGAWMSAGAIVASPARSSSLQIDAGEAAIETSSLAARSLGELASSAPEISFPDPIAELDAQVASAEAVPTEKRPISIAQPVRGARSVMALPLVAAMSPAPVATRMATPDSTISYSLPPKVQTTGANLMDAIRAQVADQLNIAKPRAGVPAVVPIAPGPSSIAGVAKLPTKPANSPALFPVSGVNR